MRKGVQVKTGRPLRSALLGALLACVLLAGLGGVASASTTNDLRGEWSYVVKCSCTFPPPIGGSTLPGTVIISQMDLATGAFMATSTLDGFIPSPLSGTVTENQISLVLEVPSPEGSNSLEATGTVEGGGSEITSSGAWTDPPSPASTFTAKRIRTYQQIEKEEEEKKKEIEAREAKEAKEAQEAKEAKEAKEAQEAKEKEQQSKEAQERAAKEKVAQEAKAAQAGKEKAEAEAKAAQAAQAAREAREREERERAAAGAMPAGLSAKTFTVGASGLVALGLSNPNDYSISGAVTLTSASTGRASHGAARGRALASATYTISSHASKTVKLKLSKGARTALARHRTVQVVVRITTVATGHAAITKTYSVTLKAAAAAKHH